ncbi:hypothetical protein ScPMuIL_001118 [Solemya velum]
MNDYTLDSRGDVGAWTREASMTALSDLACLVVEKDPSIITPEIAKMLICCLVQQACEKIDRTRAHAGRLFEKLLYHQPEIPHIPWKRELLKLFPKSEVKKINWAAPADTFPKFTCLLEFPVYMYHVLLGLTVSVGGLTESLVRYSSSSLYSYLYTIQNNEEKISVFAELVLQLFRENVKMDRISIPLLKMVDQVLTRGCFEIFAADASCKFAIELLDRVKKEIYRSGDPQKLMAAADVKPHCVRTPKPGSILSKRRDATPGPPPDIVLCENQSQLLTCQSGTVIQIDHADYGRTEGDEVCGGPVLTTNCSADCETAFGRGWKSLDVDVSQSCYLFLGKPKENAKAEEKCENRGGHLVKIESAAENKMILSELMDTHMD